MLPSPPGKKSAQQSAAFGSEQPSLDRGMKIQALHAEQIDDAAVHPGFLVACTVYHSCNARMHDGAGAHGAGLEGDVERSSGQTVIAELACRIA